MSCDAVDVLFEDPLDGTPVDGWCVPPSNFVEHPDGGAFYFLTPGEGSTVENPPWVGDETWRSYRIEFDVCTAGENDGWVGPDYHVSDDGRVCSNLQFYSTRERDEVVFETSARWEATGLCWKLYPMAQRVVRIPKGEWARVRVDVGDSFANIHVNGESGPCYTVRYLPFARGGVRFWNYYGSAWFRNLRVTALGDGEISPVLDDPWAAVVGEGVVRDWRMSPLFSEGACQDDALACADSVETWREAPVDERGVAIVSAAGDEYATGKGVVLARTSIRSDTDGERAGFLTYTDQLTVWVNGREVFRGESRGWFDSGRSPEDGFGRLVPDQFEVRLPLEKGDNEIVVRLEIKEPLFGSGFWMRLR